MSEQDFNVILLFLLIMRLAEVSTPNSYKQPMTYSKDTYIKFCMIEI